MQAVKILILVTVLSLGAAVTGSRASSQTFDGEPPSSKCPYGYFNYSPYHCAPYGYYGPEWFSATGKFYGAGQWFRGPKDFQQTVHKEYDPLFGYKGKLPKPGDSRTQPIDAAHFHPEPAQ